MTKSPTTKTLHAAGGHKVTVTGPAKKTAAKKPGRKPVDPVQREINGLRTQFGEMAELLLHATAAFREGIKKLSDEQGDERKRLLEQIKEVQDRVETERRQNLEARQVIAALERDLAKCLGYIERANERPGEIKIGKDGIYPDTRNFAEILDRSIQEPGPKLEGPPPSDRDMEPWSVTRDFRR